MNIHIIGIGGIGTSALAKHYIYEGHTVSGSDLNESETTQSLENLGVKIFIGPHSSSNIAKDLDLVVYTLAIPFDNPELIEARNLRLKCITYPEALGELTEEYFTIAVSGTHGKSTTTSMIGLLLMEAGLDPTIIVGTKLKELDNSNYRAGKSKYLVIEACEFKGAFLHYRPEIIILTNIEEEHMDFFKDLDHIFEVYTKYVQLLPENGLLIANQDDKNAYRIGKKLKEPIRLSLYSIKQKEFEKLKNILKIPGKHNISNALAALAVARELNIKDEISFNSLGKYTGSWRRFEKKLIKINNKEHSLIIDYGHHPTEIRVTLESVREKYPNKEIYCIFQPHQYQRTHYLWDNFIETFKNAPIDKIILTDIYDVAGREDEKIREKVSSEKLAKATQKESVIYVEKKNIIDHLKKELRGKEIIVVMGAGDIYKIIEDFA
ncbi:MAG: UDP-N-acetylmuramate--L-alanine ligase [Patescibacteria group bacterium]